VSDRSNPSAGAERREYFRVDDSVLLDYRLLGEGEPPDPGDREEPGRFTVMADFAAKSRHMHRLAHRIRRQSADLARYLELLDDKLNTLARLCVDQATGDMDRSARPVSLSAGGIRFRAGSALAAGALLELRMVLLPSRTGLMVRARVVHCQPADPEGEFPYQVGVEFEDLREVDRELLVRHLLGRQARHLHDDVDG